MTKEQLSKLQVNQRVSHSYLSFKIVDWVIEYGYVTKIYNGNHQVQVWFDGAKKPVVMGYKQIEIVEE